jgi:ribonuclease BN (tRNA processing enzyme)
MILRMLGPTVGGHAALSSYLVNGSTLIDCGGAGFCGDLARQAAVKDVFLTHSHVDHVASLPILLDNVYGLGSPPILHATSATLATLHQELFRGGLWPDLFELSERMAPFVWVQPLTHGEPIEVRGVKITGVSVDHVVPTTAYILEEPGAAVAVVTDTAPTVAVWERLAAVPNVKAVFLECSFPEELAAVAAASKHLTPSLFAAQAARRPRGSRLFAVHLKVQHHDKLVEQLRRYCPDAEIAMPEVDYTFTAG